MRSPIPSLHRQATAFTCALIGTLLLCVGCDTSVNVLNPSDEYRYSLFGTLNVATDTQVIRVEPLGDSTRLGAPPEFNATVVLKNLNTGVETTLQDSFTTVGGGIAKVHNFWTTVSIQPDTRYRVSIREDGEPVTTATTKTPVVPPTLRHRPETTSDRPFQLPCDINPSGEAAESDNSFSVQASNVTAVAAAKVIYPLSFVPQVQSTIGHLSGVEATQQDDVFTVSVHYGKDLLRLNSRNPDPSDLACVPQSAFTVPAARLAVTAGGPDWPPWLDASLNDLARPDTFSNVEGGHGFVGGVYTDTIRVPIQQRQ